MRIIGDKNRNDNYLYLNFMPTHDVFRRNLIKGMLVLPWWFTGPAIADAPPDARRIIALEWRPAELLLALGVTPLAIADVPNYRNWVMDPPLAPSVLDVGLRNEPNLEAIQRLRPSLILLSNGFGPDPASVSPLAPIMTFAFSDAAGLPLAVARNDVVRLGARLGLSGRAKQHLLTLDQQMSQTRRRLSSIPRRPLLLFSFIDSRRIMVIGKRSLFQEVMDQVGVENAWRGEVNAWGSTVIGIERLAQMRGVEALCFRRSEQDPLDDAVRSPLWQVIPFVREQRWRSVPAIWFFGATIAAMRFCRQLEHSLGQPA